MGTKHSGKGKLIYFSTEEMAIIEHKAQKANLDISKFIRKMSTQGIMIINDFKNVDELIYEIHKIGVNVNQLAKKANEINSIYKVDIEMMKQEYDNLCLMLNQYLSKIQSIKA